MIETIIAPNPGPFTLDGTRSYVIDGRIVVDPGPAIASHVEAILRAAPHLQAILVTHRHGDHAPAAVDLKHARPDAQLITPRTVLENMADRTLDGDTELTFEDRVIRAVATPGHTSEHFCFLTREGDLFTGDTVLGEGTTVIFPPDGHMQSYFATLRKLIALAPRAIYPGHGPVRTDAVELLRNYLAHREARETQIVQALSDGAKSIPQLRLEIYPGLDERLIHAAELQLESHLTHLMERALVARRDDLFALL
jgi:glyoxylase-like metal-dependent hydrolase (beta-lactamase superfamily II)